MRWIERSRRRRLRGVTFCDDCGQVCDAACRQRAVREHHQLSVLRLGLGR